MTERSLVASIDQQVIGRLHENQNLWAFEYDRSWLENPDRFALSPHLPLQEEWHRDGSTTRPCQWYFDNLLPEETVRKLLAKDAKLPDEHDAFALLAYYGRESAGSLTLRPPGGDDEQVPHEALRPLTDEALNERIRELPRVPLTHDAPKKMSLAGAQHKLPVVVRDGQLYEPGSEAVSTHILKPNHPNPDGFPNTVINEWFVMKLADGVGGLPVPEVSRRYVPAPVYLIERFDRRVEADRVSRRHAIDGCQLLGLAATSKYPAWSIDSLLKLIDRCRAPGVVRLRIFRWLVFCVLVGNGDSHLKNLSFLVDKDGITLSPFYDLLSEAVSETRFVMEDKARWPDLSEFTGELFGEKRYAHFSRGLLEDAGEALGLTRAVAARQIEELLERIPAQADALIEQTVRENEALAAERPELTAILGGEIRLLRAIRRTVIHDMARRISGRD
ncbi:HipA domain-containing protein [Burkholderia sp. Cy-637]|uniref:HipA domain-containing protein n=1 Tax=Burkholderia sp. Cy-637 TaxID=2608327 RepID=UPI00141FA704|nr:HipA domain-containing protein [Burkholderia sp. Cy-637]NIF93061.1 type II toxin-antitoxin system HipA family toxin [Burkholderia sp. Cy-637]